MFITDPIFSLVWDISDYFYEAWLEVRGWVWPFNLLQYPFYAISTAFWRLLTPIATLGDWIDGIAGQLGHDIGHLRVAGVSAVFLKGVA
ncbi:hypothetical protein LCGC14_1281020 [marine sediment metagenome]|uniref:Uncharacterized protein n=1 Tax=marine sediment metagenome TaxID=412755 RepID=A0A0F9LG96_9ZZZZ